jgi:hypothetical protein
MSIPTPEQYFLETGLYTAVKLDATEAKEALVRIQFHVDPLDAYCESCGQHSVFRSTGILPVVGPAVMARTPAASVDELLTKKRALLPQTDDEGISLSQQDIIAYVTRPKVFTNLFICSRDDRHELRFITRVSPSDFAKIGQSPSVASLHLGDIAKYRNVLGTEYTELAKGIGLFAHGVGVGSFVYLRRIFEHQIAEARAAAAADASWDEGAYQRSRMDEKILLLQAHLPSFVVENRSIYSILSKGIHELGEAECLEYFPVVRVAIELILDEKLEAKQKAQKVAGSRAAIGRILGKLGGRSS